MSGRVARLLEERPVALTAGFAIAAAVCILCWRVGLALLGDANAPLSGPAEWVAWPGGMGIPFLGGAVALAILLLPDRRLTGRARGLLARLAVWGALGFALVQLLDDHMLDHPGNANPTGLSIPSPYQDYLSLVGLAVLFVAILGAVLTLGGRVAASVAARRSGRAP